MTEYHVGAGDVQIVLDGKEYTLRPSLNAALTISRQSGGIRGAIDSVVKMDLDVIVSIIQLGLGKNVARTINDLPEKVWAAGLTDNQSALLAKCIDYLHILANGGKPINSTEMIGEDERPLPRS